MQSPNNNLIPKKVLCFYNKKGRVKCKKCGIGKEEFVTRVEGRLQIVSNLASKVVVLEQVAMQL